MAGYTGNPTCYRIPSMIGPFPPDSDAILVFAEGREPDCYDVGKHGLAFTRSVGKGEGSSSGNGSVMLRSMAGERTWSPVTFLYNDTDPLKDGLNLGASVYDPATKTVWVLFNECANEYGKPPCGKCLAEGAWYLFCPTNELHQHAFCRPRKRFMVPNEPFMGHMYFCMCQCHGTANYRCVLTGWCRSVDVHRADCRAVRYWQ